MEWIRMEKCCKCWLYGQLAAQCEGEAYRRADCNNCGQRGHHSRDCKTGKHCPLCKEDGHSADTGGCPILRSALRDARGHSIPALTLSYRPDEPALLL